MFHNTTSDLQDQDQDHSMQDQDEDQFFWSQTGLVLRPTVSDHITVKCRPVSVPAVMEEWGQTFAGTRGDIDELVSQCSSLIDINYMHTQTQYTHVVAYCLEL